MGLIDNKIHKRKVKGEEIMEYKRATIAKVKDTIVIPAIDLIEVKPKFNFSCMIDNKIKSFYYEKHGHYQH